MDIKDILKERKAKGILIKIIDAMALPVLAKDAGMDYLFFDCEHGLIGQSRLHDLILMANAVRMPCLVRAPELSRTWVSRTLDCGAQGIMIPMIETKEQAQQLVEWAKYPPVGNRSYSGGANTFYAKGGHHAENMKAINEKTLAIVQIETRRGIENIDGILRTEGIDAAIIGPCDLGISMDNPDNVLDPEELKAIAAAAGACRKHGKYFGIIGGMELLHLFRKDLDLLTGAIDTNLLREGMAAWAEKYDALSKK